MNILVKKTLMKMWTEIYEAFFVVLAAGIILGSGVGIIYSLKIHFWITAICLVILGLFFWFWWTYDVVKHEEDIEETRRIHV